MVTLESIDREILDHEREGKRLTTIMKESVSVFGQDSIKKELHKLSRRVSFLRKVRAYIETCPTVTCIEKQIEILSKKVQRVDDRIDRIKINYPDPNAQKKEIQELKKSERYSLMNAQLRTLRFILQ